MWNTLKIIWKYIIMENKEQLIQAIKEWVKIENEISVLQREIKNRKERKKQMASTLLDVMKSNEIDAFDITGGRLVYSRTKSKAAITKKSLIGILGDYFKDQPQMAEELASFIHENREQKISETVRTKFDNK
jgi:hypothetical protein